MTQYVVVVEMGDSDDPPMTVDVIGPFRSLDIANETMERFNRHTGEAYERAQQDEVTAGFISRWAFVRPCHKLGPVVEDANEYLWAQCINDEPRENAS